MYVYIYGIYKEYWGCAPHPPTRPSIFLIYSTYIYIYIFAEYFPYMFPCVFLNLWSQQKKSAYRKTTFIFFQILRLFMFYYQFYPLYLQLIILQAKSHEEREPRFSVLRRRTKKLEDLESEYPGFEMLVLYS